MTREEALASPLMKMVVELNEEELKKDGKTAKEIFDFIDKEYEFFDIKPNIGGVYLGNNLDSDYSFVLYGGGDVFDEIKEVGYLKYLKSFKFYMPNNEYDDDFCELERRKVGK